MLACTKSNIAKLVATERDVECLDWLAIMMSDPECVIACADNFPRTWKEIVTAAKTNPGEQIWAGPATGGADHVMALKIWDAVNISAKWLPHKGGGAARAALLGGQAVVALSGVVVNSSLVLVHYVNQRRNAGKPVAEAVRDAGVARFRPIVLTSLTTFAGLTPLLSEGSVSAKFLIPMATSLAFGVVFASSISLFLVPSLYMILEDAKRALRRRFLDNAPDLARIELASGSPPPA